MKTISTKTIPASREVCLKISKRFHRGVIAEAMESAIRMACETGSDVFIYASCTGLRVQQAAPVLGPMQKAFVVSWVNDVATVVEIQNS